MKKTLLILCTLIAAVSAQAATILASLGHIQEANITYQSVDQNNKAVTLSAKLYYYKYTEWFKTKYQADFVVLNCHPTISHNEGCPTGSDPQLEAVKYMTTEKALVICPDYLGFGASKDKVHPYMCNDLTARNVLDCYKAAIAYAKSHSVTLAKNYYTINIGYSQGGSTALAFQKYLETKATDADRKFVNLQGSLCGAGPYDLGLAIDIYEQMPTMSYPALIPYVLQGLYSCYSNTLMKDITLQQCFTSKFWNSGFMDKLNAKKTNIDDLNSWLIKNGFKNFYDIMSATYADRSSNIYKNINAALDEQNLLNGEWTPEAPIVFYHYQNDEVVPPAETDAAMEAFAGCQVVKLTQDDYTISDNQWWDIAFSLGGYSRTLNHRNCGVYFYLMFLAGNMRPDAVHTGKTNCIFQRRAKGIIDEIEIPEEEVPLSINQAGTEATVNTIYGINGAKRNKMQGGVNIIKMSDGTVRKVLK